MPSFMNHIKRDNLTETNTIQDDYKKPNSSIKILGKYTGKLMLLLKGKTFTLRHLY